MVKPGQQHVFLVDDKNIIERRAVRIGQIEDGMRVVEEGLRPQDWVVTTNLGHVEAGMTVTPDKPTASTPAVELKPMKGEAENGATLPDTKSQIPRPTSAQLE